MKTIIHYKLHDVAPYIHWGYFFHAWGFPFAYESIVNLHDCPSCRNSWVNQFPPEQQAKAKEAAELYKEATAILHEMDAGIQSHAIVGLYPANSQGNDILLWDDDGREHVLPMLRQQQGEVCLCMSDYITPKTCNKSDRIGLFVVAVDKAMEQSYPNDAYRHMICQTLADRLAEATAERTHKIVRQDLWGYAQDEKLSITEMFAEKYRGRRPAVGYPSLPDQSINFLLNDILDFNSINVRLTENAAMIPHATTSGLMLSHPAMQHFSIGRIGDDQLRDYARRRGLPPYIMEHFLTANLQH